MGIRKDDANYTNEARFKIHGLIFSLIILVVTMSKSIYLIWNKSIYFSFSISSNVKEGRKLNELFSNGSILKPFMIHFHLFFFTAPLSSYGTTLSTADTAASHRQIVAGGRRKAIVRSFLLVHQLANPIKKFQLPHFSEPSYSSLQ